MDEPRRSLPVLREDPAPPSSPAEPPKAPKRRRPYTIALRDIPKRDLERGWMLYPETEYERPHARSECIAGPHAQRPCPFVSCKHHLYLDVDDCNGSIKVNFPVAVEEDGLEDVATALELMPETCALDVAATGDAALEEVGANLNLVRESVRKIELAAFKKLVRRSGMVELLDLFDEE